MNAPLSTPVAAQRPESPLSPSQVTTFLDCAARWWYGRALKLPEPGTGKQALGKAMHSAAAAIMQHKKETGELHPLTTSARLFDNFMRAEFAQAAIRGDEHKDEIHGKGREMLMLWLARIAPAIEPVAVELPISGQIGGVRINAVIDLVDSDGRVWDWKTSGKRPSTLAADQEFQLGTYCAIGERTEATVVTLVSTATVGIQPHSLTLDAPRRKYLESIYPMIAEQMASGLYPPRRASHLCSRRNCAHWRQCEADFGGTVP